MPFRLNSQNADFPERFRSLLVLKREVAQDVEEAARRIVADVAARGDTALFELTARFDRIDLAKAGLRVHAAEIATAEKSCEAEALAALKLAHDRIEAYHLRQMPKEDRFTDALGVEMGAKWTAIEAVGLYVPGGTAAYPSSVLMNAVPAKVAGVPRLAMVVPTPEGKIKPLVLAAAKLAGVDEIYRVGGAQAVAALAYGTATIAPVAKIVGPGNAYVAAAKRLVFGKVGIDMIAGPSEVLILADKTGNADWIAADLLAQAEHDASAQPILITDDAALAAQVEKAVAASSRPCRARRLPERRGAILAQSLLCPAFPMQSIWSTSSRPSIWKSCRPMPSNLSVESAMRAPFSLALTRQRRLATMLPVPITCCRQRDRRAFRPASAFWIS